MQNDERHHTRARMPFTWALLLSASGILVTAAITWGATSEQIKTLEARTDKLEALALVHDRQIIEQRAQYTEILRRLDSIDSRLNTLQRRP